MITCCLCITDGLHGGIGGDNLIFESSVTREGRCAITAGFSKILDGTLGIDSFTSTRLSRDQHGLIVTLTQPIVVSIVRHGVNVGRHFRLSKNVIKVVFYY